MCNEIIKSLLKEVKKHAVIKNDSAFILDPIFKIQRNRIHAEVCKTLIRLQSDTKLIDQLLNTMVNSQNDDGSWNEVHPRYNHPSSLVTSFIAEAILHGQRKNKTDYISLEKAKTYILSQEKELGYFIKSTVFTADCLNVNASCGAFLAEYGRKFSDSNAISAAKRAAERVCLYQKKGSFPYTSNKGNYAYICDIPCIHYQGVTLYYLIKIQEIVNEPWLQSHINAGTEWLAGVQKSNGFFDWAKSGLMFSYYLTGAYAFAYAVFSHQSKINPQYYNNAQACLKVLKMNTPSITLRWETESWASFFFPRLVTVRTAFLGDYPLKHRLFRIGYGLYRQISRRRIQSNVNEKTFNALCRLLHISPSTIEPINNFPDLFMTSEILDCLSWQKNDSDFL